MKEKIEQIENELVITFDEGKNYTIDDLKQKLINEFYKKKPNYCYQKEEVEILRILIENKKD